MILRGKKLGQGLGPGIWVVAAIKRQDELERYFQGDRTWRLREKDVNGRALNTEVDGRACSASPALLTLDLARSRVTGT